MDTLAYFFDLLAPTPLHCLSHPNDFESGNKIADFMYHISIGFITTITSSTLDHPISKIAIAFERHKMIN